MWLAGSWDEELEQCYKDGVAMQNIAWELYGQ